jgi:hypothetical protein
MSEELENKYGSMRKFQRELGELAGHIILGRRKEKVFCISATPGGGKTRGYSIFSHELLDSGVVDNVVIVVPREALRSQTKEGFTDGDLLPRAIVDNPKYIRNGQASIYEKSGCVTTYQAIVSKPKFWLKLVTPKHSGESGQKAAELCNVSRESVRLAEKVVQSGVPELAAAVDSGKVAVSVAAVIAETSKDEQKAIVAEGKKEVRKAADEIRKRKSDSSAPDAIEAILVKIEKLDENQRAKLFARLASMYKFPASH